MLSRLQTFDLHEELWSGRRGSNSRPSAWEDGWRGIMILEKDFMGGGDQLQPAAELYLKVTQGRTP